MSDDKANIQKFLEDQYCLVVEPSQAFASTVQACLTALGVKPGMVLIARKYADACKMIQEKKPKLLVTEYEIETFLGLSLVELQEKFYPEDARISMILTKNSSDSVVAEAAEEQVDAFLLKPFSADAFSQKIKGVLERKIHPSPYISKIREGKACADKKDFTGAIRQYRAAKELNEKPTLACYYAGQVLQTHAKWDPALVEFREGRKYQPLHYKCLIGEFEVLINQKRFVEAYELVGPIKTNYPLTARRLGQLIMASIFTRHFEEIISYYPMFSNLENRTPELIKITSMALFTAGRFFIEQKDLGQAVLNFDKGAIVTARELSFLERVINELIQANALQEAQEFLDKAQASAIGTPEHNRLSFKIDAVTLNRGQLVERGRKLVQSGQGNPEIYETIVKIMVQENKITLAEATITRAISEYPKMRKLLYDILETQNANKSA